MKPEGHIITFYSYKGGTGRSMALANIGVLLTRWGYRVLLVDWDLEAPGLDFFFRSFLSNEPSCLERDGVIELLSGHEASKVECGSGRSWRDMVLKIPMPEGTSVHLLTAGKRDRDYSRRVTDLSIKKLYTENGGALIESLREEWKAEYDFTLIDSRTGITDIGGICTIQLLDYLVLLFTPTDQSLEGILQVCSRVRGAHEQLPVDRQRLLLVPVVSRIDVQQELVLLQEWTKKCAQRLHEIYQDWLPSSVDPERMLEATKLPYKPFFSFGEKLAVVEEGTSDSTSLGYAYENLAALAANELEPARSLLEDRDYYVRLASKRRRIESKQTVPTFLCYSHKDEVWKERIATHLGALAQQGIMEIWDDRQLAIGTDWVGSLEEIIGRARILLPLVSADFLASRFIIQHEVPLLVERRIKEGVRVIPVIVRPCAWEQVPWLKDTQAWPRDGKALSAMKESEAEAALADLAMQIAEPIAVQTPRAEPRAESPGIEVSPSRLPRGADRLFGREQELAALDQAWNDPKVNVVTIVAWGGVGKTALVVEWMARMARDGWRGIGRVFDWSFHSQGTREQGAVSADNFIVAALEFFGGEKEGKKLANSPASLWDKGARLAQLIGQRRNLLVLDGLEPLQYPPGPVAGKVRDPALEALLKGLAQHNAGLCIVTTRESVADLKPFRDTTAPEWLLEHLSEEAGAQLLFQAGVNRADNAEIGQDDQELRDASREVAGHALTLRLLGNYLRIAHDGDIRERGVVRIVEADREFKTDPADLDTPYGHAFKMMATYEKWFAAGGKDGLSELAILRLLGLFDRPADAGCLVALRQSPAIPGLTEPIVSLTDPQWNSCLKRLADCGLVSIQLDPSSIDCHPLIREYFAQQLREKNSVSWRSAHRRLYEHLRDRIESCPASLEGLPVLYQAVAHGYHAGKPQDVLIDEYVSRIRRRGDLPFSIALPQTIQGESNVNQQGFFLHTIARSLSE